MEGPNFFISYTGVDRAWAEWIAVTLEQAGYTTVLQSFDFRPGADFVHEMHQATDRAARTIAVLSPDYFGSRFAEAEWRSAFAKDPSGEQRLLVPVRVKECDPPGLMATRVYVDLVGLNEPTAQETLLAAVGLAARPTHAPFPGGVARPRFPGGPNVSNLGPRMRTFTGRDKELEQLHARLHDPTDNAEPAQVSVVPMEALHGLGGIGKSALALEFAHRYGGNYDIVWWILAEQPTTAAAGLAALATQVGVPPDQNQAATIQHLFDDLRRRDRWLLIYDNAEQPDALEGLLPSGGGGHILITSRWPSWSTIAEPMQLEVLDHGESIRYLSERTGSDEVALLDELAHLVGDLPLALAEAAAYLEQTRLGVAMYLTLLRDRARELFGLVDLAATGSARPDADRQRVATVWSVSLDRIRTETPAAELLLNLCAFLAPEIPRALPTASSEAFSDDAHAVLGDQIAYNTALATLGRYSLVSPSPATISVHRLVQTVVRARLTPADERIWSEAAIRLLRRAAPPGEVRDDPGLWAAWDILLPQVLAATASDRPLNGVHDDVSWLLDRAATYLQVRGSPSEALPLFERTYVEDRQHYGDDHPETLHAANNLASCLFRLKEYERSRQIDQDTLARRRRVLGPGHPDTLTSANNIANDLAGLGLKREARDIHNDIWVQRRTTLGEDDRNTLTSANNYAGAVFDTGDHELARRIDKETLDRRRAALGDDDLDTLESAHNLAMDARALKEYEVARALDEDTLTRRRGILGEDHPATIKSAENLALDLRLLSDEDEPKSK